MGVCNICGISSSGEYCTKCGRPIVNNEKQIILNNPEPFSAEQETAATAQYETSPKKWGSLPKAPRSLIIFLGLLCLLVIGTPTIIAMLKPSVLSKAPVVISNSTIISTLHSEQTLNVLEDTATASYQVSDNQIYNVFGATFQIPALVKTITVDYDYKISFGIDLSEITDSDIHVDNRSISLKLNKPESTMLQVYNEHARVDGGLLTSKSNPLDDAVRLDPNHQPLTNVLMDNTMSNLKQTNQYEKLQEQAMINVQNTISDLLTKALGKDISINVSYK